MTVPFLDLKAQYRQIKTDVDTRIQEVIDNTAFVMGKYLQNFEEDFARYQNLQHVIGTNSGTSALAIIFMAIKHLHKKDWPSEQWEAIIPCNTFIATAEAIVQAGGNPRFVDIDEGTYNMDPAAIAAAVTDRTKILVPVHLYGQPAQMDAIMEEAAKHNLVVVEDCAQAHGAKYRRNGSWLDIGGFGIASGYSFYPGKNLGAYGDGGAVGTNNSDITDYIKMYRDHGSKIKYEHEFSGSTDRLDSLQAAVLSVKLKYLEEWNKKRRHNAMLYKEYFSTMEEVILPHVPEWTNPVWHLYVIRVKDRHGLQQYLQQNGIGCGFHYKHPLHLQEAYRHLGYQKGDFPITEKVMGEIISLPMFAELTEEQIKHVVEKVKDFVVGKK